MLCWVEARVVLPEPAHSRSNEGHSSAISNRVLRPLEKYWRLGLDDHRHHTHDLIVDVLFSATWKPCRVPCRGESDYRFSWMKRELRWTSTCTKGESPIALKLWISPALMTKMSPTPPAKVLPFTVHTPRPSR